LILQAKSSNLLVTFCSAKEKLFWCQHIWLNKAISTNLLAQALAAKRKGASTTLSFCSVDVVVLMIKLSENQKKKN